jgi:hypothetical protein
VLPLNPLKKTASAGVQKAGRPHRRVCLRISASRQY